MSVLRCTKCGYKTNSAVCNWIKSPAGKADKCYARYNNGWEKGCSFEEASKFMKNYIESSLLKISKE